MPVSSEPCTAEALAAYLPAARLRSVICTAQTGSTNRDIKAMAMIDAVTDGTVVTADAQTDGRGRFGRSFESPRDKGVYLSLFLDHASLPESQRDVTPLAAVAVCRAIQRLYDVMPDIKWVNDILLGGKKIAGILAETVSKPNKPASRGVVLGIGINVTTEQNDFPYDARTFASSLMRETGKTVSRAALTGALIEELDRVFYQKEPSREECLAFYRARCRSIGQPVQILRGSERRQALSLSLEDDFSLRVRYEDGTEEAVSSGEVSVRGLYGYVD